MSTLRDEWFVETARVNAVVGWLLVAVLVVLVGVGQLVGDPVAAAHAAVVAAVVLVPAAVSRDWQRMPPALLVFLATVPLVVAPVASGVVGTVASTVGVATLALLVVAALQLVTTVRMTVGFAVVFVVVAAMGTAGFWAVGRYAGSVFLGTPFVETNDQLMVEFLWVTATGVVAGLGLRWYLQQFERADGEADAA